MLLQEVGAQIGGTHLDYEGYQICLSLISGRLDELSHQEIEAARCRSMSSDTSGIPKIFLLLWRTWIFKMHTTCGSKSSTDFLQLGLQSKC